MKLYRIILSLLFFCLFFANYQLLITNHVFAESKNIFGIHLADPQDIHSAKDVINSSGGDWGWATIVIRTDQLNFQMWQEFFDNCRKFHIIPILRLSTTMEQNFWRRPTTTDIDNLASFLNSLNWPSTRRHLIIFNEINHASEWGGEVDINNFTDISIYTYQKFKSLNPDFYLLSAGIDLAAPEQPPQFKSAESVYREIYSYRPEYFTNIDALASHSYPNHGFIGLPSDTGVHSVHGFLWEQSFINSLGVATTYPVFITETGWPHREGEKNHNFYYTTKTTASLLLTSFINWSKYPQIQAVTPFIYNFPYEPFDHFSWLDKNGQIYPEYQNLIDYPKQANQPSQKISYQLVDTRLPLIIINQKEHHGRLILKNTGESVWGEKHHCLEPETGTGIEIGQICLDGQFTYPQQTKIIDFYFKVSSNDSQTKKIIAWKGIDPIEISAFSGNSALYHPKLSLKSIYYHLLYSIFN